MSFDPSLSTVRDRIRMIVGDTSNDEDAEFFIDESYDAVISQHSNWKIAAAVMAEGVAVQIEQDPSSFTAVGDMSVGWSDRTRSLRETARRLRSEAAAEDTAIDNSIVSVPLVRHRSGGAAEYVPSRYSRLKR